jgi:thioredoxin 1
MEEVIMHRVTGSFAAVAARITRHHGALAAVLLTLAALALAAPLPCAAASPVSSPAAEGRIVPVSLFSFGSQVLQAKMPVLVDFSAAWCLPCKALEKSLEWVAATAGDRVRVVRVNVTWNRHLAKLYDVQALPTLLVFDHGAVVERATGVLGPDDIRDLLTNSTHVSLATAAAPKHAANAAASL